MSAISAISEPLKWKGYIMSNLDRRTLVKGGVAVTAGALADSTPFNWTKALAQPAPAIRRSPNRAEVDTKLGFLAEIAGTWEGSGFNLIGRPDKQGNSPVFLELNQTFETLSFTPVSSSIPNRGFAVDDIELFGLTYLQKISDSVTGGALHIEPGIWITQPATTQPPETAPAGAQIIARMATIPH